ncbi:hypothetical protein, partial [Succinatimonas hippei]|uniref:hypothetical protein n=1 Tax=Succinatimonas hippei TaxID=626938 RepID=UPI00249120C4
KTLCVKPKFNQHTFNYALKKLKEENPFLKEYCHSQVLQQKLTEAYNHSSIVCLAVGSSVFRPGEDVKLSN